MIELPEPHRAVEVSQDYWVWPICELHRIDNTEMFCADVFRASGATFIRMVHKKHLGDYEARRYVPGTYFTVAEWTEVQ
jgi:hypothetical protein